MVVDDFMQVVNTFIVITSTKIYHRNFVIENKNVILVDDVLYTGRTIRSAMDALVDFGRPAKVELMVLVDRRFTRHVPIQPDYVGISIDTIQNENVRVDWGKKQGEAHQIQINQLKEEINRLARL